MTSDGHGRSSHGEEDQESNETNEAEHLEISSDSPRIALDFETNSEGERQAEAQHRTQDVDTRYWMTLEETGRRIGEMIADNSNHYNEDELYDVIPDEQETFDWYRQQMLMRGEGVETHLVHAGHELAGLINQILDTAMTQRVVLNGDMFGRLQILHKEILEAIDDGTTPEGSRRNFRFIKKLQRLEREAIEKATNDMNEAGRNESLNTVERYQRGEGREAGEELRGIEEAMLQVLPEPEEAHIIPGERNMAGLAFAAGTAETTERTTYAGSCTDRIRAGLQDGEPPYLRRRMIFMEEVISEDDDDMDKENEEPDDAEHDS